METEKSEADRIKSDSGSHDNFKFRNTLLLCISFALILELLPRSCFYRQNKNESSWKLHEDLFNSLSCFTSDFFSSPQNDCAKSLRVPTWGVQGGCRVPDLADRQVLQHLFCGKNSNFMWHQFIGDSLVRLQFHQFSMEYLGSSQAASLLSEAGNGNSYFRFFCCPGGSQYLNSSACVAFAAQNTVEEGDVVARVTKVLLEFLTKTWKETEENKKVKFYFHQSTVAKPMCASFLGAFFAPHVSQAMQMFSGQGPVWHRVDFWRRLEELENASIRLAPTSFIISTGVWSLVFELKPVDFVTHFKNFFMNLAALQEADAASMLLQKNSTTLSGLEAFVLQRDPVSVVLHFISPCQESVWDIDNPRRRQLANAKIVAVNRILEENWQSYAALLRARSPNLQPALRQNLYKWLSDSNNDNWTAAADGLHWDGIFSSAVWRLDVYAASGSSSTGRGEESCPVLPKHAAADFMLKDESSIGF